MASRRPGFWILLSFALIVFLFGLLIFGINRLLLGSEPKLTANTVLELRLSGSLAERPSARFGNNPLGPLTVREIDQALRRAADDPRVIATTLHVGPMATGLAKVQEIRAAVEAFGRSDKPVFAFLEIGTILDLYAASSADTVVQVPSGNLLLGLMARHLYYRDLLDTLGVEFEVFHTGPYKTAMNAFTERQITDGEREIVNSLLDSIFSQLVDDIAADRGLGAAAVRQAIDRGILSAPEAQEAGLIDQLAFRDQVLEQIESTVDGEVRRVGVRQYLRGSESSFALSILQPSDTIAVVHVDGLLIPGETGTDPLGGARFTGGDTIARELRKAKDHDDVRAIVIRIDSPGGAVTAADVIAREVSLAAERMPVVISMSDVAASGGYWIATAGTRILADPATYTGSIGVILSRINLAGAYQKLQIHTDLIKRGANADIFTDTQPLTPEQATLLTSSLEAMYARFIERVASARQMSIEAVETLAAGRVWTGQQALDNNLIDGIGGLYDAIEVAREEAGLPADVAPRLRFYPDAPSLLDQARSLLFMTLGPSASNFSPVLEVGLRLLTRQHTLTDQSRFLRNLARSGHFWALAHTPLPEPAH